MMDPMPWINDPDALADFTDAMAKDLARIEADALDKMAGMLDSLVIKYPSSPWGEGHRTGVLAAQRALRMVAKAAREKGTW